MSAPHSGALPPNYREALYWRVMEGPRRALAVNLLGLPLLAVFGTLFFWFAGRWGHWPEWRTPLLLVTLVGGAVLTLVLHELAHGAAMRWFGARPRYGILAGALAFYATAPGYAFTRNQYLSVTLAPLVGLSLLAMAGMRLAASSPAVELLAAWASVNAAGASGDMWMAAIVARYPAACYVTDERDGMRIFLPV